MTDSPPEANGTDTAEPAPEPESDPVASSIAAAVGGKASVEHDNPRVRVPAERWVEAATAAREEGLVFFSWLSAVDWSNQVEVGDPPAAEVEERYEVVCALSDLTEGRLVLLSTDIAKESPAVDSLVGVYAGANWHEREAHEMYGIDFRGHPYLLNLYLPDQFEGNPLRKSYPLLTREVKPWPGTVDVEPMPQARETAASDAPSVENPEA